jgi:cation diffusion facilitator CzcD-associated flavoprotein CzcO
VEGIPRVCVIGAGASGLAAGKALADGGVRYVCFEASDDIGGQWHSRNPTGGSSAYRSLHIQSSKQGSRSSSGPPPLRP